MSPRLILIYAGLLTVSIHTLTVGQGPHFANGPSREQTRPLISNVPRRIGFISDIGGGSSLYAADPDHSDVNLWGRLHSDNVKIPNHGLVFSRDRKRVIFVATPTGGKNPSLWQMNTDGSEFRKLIDWKWQMHWPFRASWSPAGDRIAFVATMPTSSAIYTVNVDGSNLSFVADGDDFSWSPDGRQLAYAGYVTQQPGRYLRIVNIDGTNVRQISSAAGVSDAAWSPDGKLVAFIDARAETTPVSQFNVFVIQPDGRQQKMILENVAVYSRLTWSPNSEFLSFVTNFEGKRGLYTWAPQKPSTGRVRFFTGVEGSFDWSPDSKQVAYGRTSVNLVDVQTSEAKILFHTSGFGGPLWLSNGNQLLLFRTTHLPGDSDLTQDLDLYVTNREPRFVRRLTDKGLHVLNLSSSPTGKLIAFVASPPGRFAESTVYIVNSDGSDMRKLLVSGIEPGWFAWSPDGKKIAFVKEMTNCIGCSSKNFEIHVANSDGSDEQILIKDPSWNFAPAWLPDGKSIVFLSDRANTNGIYAVDLKSKRTRLVLDISSWIGDEFKVGIRDRFVPLLWSPDATKLAIKSKSSARLPFQSNSINVIDLTKPLSVFRIFGVAPSVLSWTPDSQRIVVVDLVHGSIGNSMTPSYVDVLSVDGSSRVRLIPPASRSGPQFFTIAWRLDGARFASNGISIFDSDGSNQRWIINGFRPAWIQ